MMVDKIVSGGQTGADRAALDVALSQGLDCGGWVPKGRSAEDGPIPPKYPNLVEADSAEPRLRTELNVRDSDATVVLTHGDPIGGSAITLDAANRLAKPLLHLDLSAMSSDVAAHRLAQWLGSLTPHTLNVAGPRSSEDPRIYDATRSVLSRALHAVRIGNQRSPDMRGADNSEPEEPLRLEVARAASAEAAANFRHWDQIRWLAPYWFCVLATGAATILGSQNVPAAVLRIAGLTIAIFGILCLILIVKLGQYHNAAVVDLDSTLQHLVRDPQLRAALSLRLRFRFKGVDLFKTATLYFGIYILAVVLVGLYTFIVGKWWST